MSSDRVGDSQLRPRVLREPVRNCGKMKQAYCHQHRPPLLPDTFVRGQEDSEGLRGSHLQLPGGHCIGKMTCHKKDDLPTGSGSTPPPATSVQAKGERVPQTWGLSQPACSYPAPEAWEANLRRTCGLGWWYLSSIWMGLHRRGTLLCNGKSGWNLTEQYEVIN